MKYFGNVDWEGITLRRYGIDPKDLLNANADPGQADFYQFSYNGLENMTTAAGFPLFASKPHFYDADDVLLLGVEGMNPSQEHHDTYVDFEPITGVAMRAAKRLQINNVIFPLPTVEGGAVEDYELKKHFPDYADVFDCLEQDWTGINEAYVPYAWTDEHYAYSDDDAGEFKELVYGTQDLAASISLWSAGERAGYEERKMRAAREERSDDLTKTRALGNTTSNDNIDERSEEQDPNEVLSSSISRERALSTRTDKDARTWKYDVQRRLVSLIAVAISLPSPF